MDDEVCGEVVFIVDLTEDVFFLGFWRLERSGEEDLFLDFEEIVYCFGSEGVYLRLVF